MYVVTRFRPLSFNVPKPLFPLAGQPMVHHPISACKKVCFLFSSQIGRKATATIKAVNRMQLLAHSDVSGIAQMRADLNKYKEESEKENLDVCPHSMSLYMYPDCLLAR